MKCWGVVPGSQVKTFSMDFEEMVKHTFNSAGLLQNVV